MKEAESYWQNQIATVKASLDLVKEQMERESQQKIEALIQQHRAELGNRKVTILLYSITKALK